jgi:NAD(P)-dependent dehydrogenase (short-subunit alcohol dehydrogenase family)
VTERWTPAQLPDLAGTTAVVTGANSGLGLETSVELARAGARVVLACRDAARGDVALGQVRVRAPGSVAELRGLDLADLASVRAFAQGLTDDLRAAGTTLGLLVNNAGIMAIPRRTTAQGFEMQLGTNHLGHFALTGLLLPALLASGASGGVGGGPARVVTVSSAAHRMGRLDRDDLMGERRYRPWGAYGQSKLANLLFMRELRRRAEAASVPLLSLAAHPGYAATNLQAVGPQMSGSRLGSLLTRVGNGVFAQSAQAGAWPTLRAAGDPAARSGDYFGPGGFAEQRGHPVAVGMTAAARDDDAAAWLWQRSAELTGVDPAFAVTT